MIFTIRRGNSAIAWRNGSASDSRSEGCVFESRRGQYSFIKNKHVKWNLFPHLYFKLIKNQNKADVLRLREQFLEFWSVCRSDKHINSQPQHGFKNPKSRKNEKLNLIAETLNIAANHKSMHFNRILDITCYLSEHNFTRTRMGAGHIQLANLSHI